MTGKRKYKRNIYSRKVSFSVAAHEYTGTIDNISPDGVHVRTQTPPGIGAGDAVRITLATADRAADVREARIVWADASGFGAKFRT